MLQDNPKLWVNKDMQLLCSLVMWNEYYV